MLYVIQKCGKKKAATVPPPVLTVRCSTLFIKKKIHTNTDSMFIGA